MGLEESKTHFFHDYVTNFYGVKCHALSIHFSELEEIICQLQMFPLWVYSCHLLQIRSVPWIPLSHIVTMTSGSIQSFVAYVSFSMTLDSPPHCCILKYWIPSFSWLSNISPNKYITILKIYSKCILSTNIPLLQTNLLWTFWCISCVHMFL